MYYIIEEFIKTPHYNLSEIQRKIVFGNYSITKTAKDKAYYQFGLFDDSEIIEHILKLKPTHFYKSMKAKKFINLWQDVYHLYVKGIEAYIKLQIRDNESVVIQFKQKDEDEDA